MFVRFRFALENGIRYYGVNRETQDSAMFANVFAELRIIVVVEAMVGERWRTFMSKCSEKVRSVEA